jgi:hypothetical protein
VVLVQINLVEALGRIKFKTRAEETSKQTKTKAKTKTNPEGDLDQTKGVIHTKTEEDSIQTEVVEAVADAKVQNIYDPILSRTVRI